MIEKFGFSEVLLKCQPVGHIICFFNCEEDLVSFGFFKFISPNVKFIFVKERVEGHSFPNLMKVLAFSIETHLQHKNATPFSYKIDPVKTLIHRTCETDSS